MYMEKSLISSLAYLDIVGVEVLEAMSDAAEG